MNAITTASIPDDAKAKLTVNGTVAEMRELAHALRGFGHPNSKVVNDFIELVRSTINQKLVLEGVA